jgi:hypothetical protein
MSNAIPNTIAKRADEVHVGDILVLGDSVERVSRIVREGNRLVRLYTGTRFNGRFIEVSIAVEDALPSAASPTFTSQVEALTRLASASSRATRSPLRGTSP